MIQSKEQAGFFTLLFHGLYSVKDKDRPKHPYIFISLDEFNDCIRMLLDDGFTFLRPEDLINGDITRHYKQLLLTFDDGYYNNYYALDILEKYSIKALFFFVQYQIVKKELFWWDAYFEYRIREAPFPSLYEEIQELKRHERSDIEEKLKVKFGDGCLKATDDFNRTMNVKELKEFSKHPSVEIGVHSASHEILTNCSNKTIKQEISSCKEFLEDITGKKIRYIAYPNGNFNDSVITIANEFGFTSGFTTISGFNHYNELNNPKSRLTLKREVFPLPRDQMSVVRQVEGFKNQILSQ